MDNIGSITLALVNNVSINLSGFHVGMSITQFIIIFDFIMQVLHRKTANIGIFLTYKTSMVAKLQSWTEKRLQIWLVSANNFTLHEISANGGTFCGQAR